MKHIKSLGNRCFLIIDIIPAPADDEYFVLKKKINVGAMSELEIQEALVGYYNDVKEIEDKYEGKLGDENIDQIIASCSLKNDWSDTVASKNMSWEEAEQLVQDMISCDEFEGGDELWVEKDVKAVNIIYPKMQSQETLLILL